LDDDSHTRETYAHFGLAMYLAQVLEHGLVNAMVVARLPEPNRIQRSSIDDFMDQKFEQTLGRLIRDLRDFVEVPDEVGDQLAEALRTRNWLAHAYFRERAAQFLTRAGRNQMISELKDAQELFHRTYRALEDILAPIREKFGLTEETLQREIDRVRAETELR
jgi:predicted RNA polymerase sigma factor